MVSRGLPAGPVEPEAAEQLAPALVRLGEQRLAVEPQDSSKATISPSRIASRPPSASAIAASSG
jgi:hypothetical protein